MSFDLGSQIEYSTPGPISRSGPPSTVLSDTSSDDNVFSEQSETLVDVGSDLERELSAMAASASRAYVPVTPPTRPTGPVWTDSPT